jgi:hypothetical protein
VCVENLSQRRKMDEASALRNGTVVWDAIRGPGAYVRERKINKREGGPFSVIMSELAQPK